jgi:hypothetical protein
MLLALAALVGAMLPVVVRAQFYLTGTPTITLDMSGMGGTPMNIAWDPISQQYYGGMGGNGSDPFRVWNAGGATVQTLSPANIDLRSLNYNSRTGSLEIITYNAVNSGGGGFQNVVRNGAGLLSGTYTSLGVSLTGLQSSQVMPALDAGRNVYYSFETGNIVKVVSHDTGVDTASVTLDLASANASTLMSHALGYDPVNDVLVSFTTDNGNRALIFTPGTGAFVASVGLPGLNPAGTGFGYNMGFANNQLFVFDNALNGYRGYALSAVPEPETVGMLFAGLAPVAYRCWRRRRA